MWSNCILSLLVTVNFTLLKKILKYSTLELFTPNTTWLKRCWPRINPKPFLKYLKIKYQTQAIHLFHHTLVSKGQQKNIIKKLYTSRRLCSSWSRNFEHVKFTNTSQREDLFQYRKDFIPFIGTKCLLVVEVALSSPFESLF